MKFLQFLLAGISSLIVQAVSRLMQERGTATARASTLYTSYDVSKYPPDARDRGGRVVPVYFEATIVSASNISDTYQLFTLPKGWSVADIVCTTNGLGASAGAGCTFQIGDSGDDDRFMKATDFDAAEAQGALAYAGVAYRPTADVIVLGKIGTAAAVVGKLVKGHALLIPGS